nr:hypothetical protein [Actinomycetales bacterium]
MNSQQDSTRSTWGRARIGGARVPALAIAVPVGLVLAIGIAFGVHYGGGTGEDPVLTIAIIALAVALPAIALIYAIVVDRETIKGAVARPEDSVEARWYEQAAFGAFTDLLLLSGIGAVVASFLRWEAEVNLVLGGLLLVAFVSFGIRYLVIRGR